MGHIFTEYGAARDQCRVDSFMHTSFADDTALWKATATLMNYHSGNFYQFMRKLYQFNRTLPDSLKIREHFTDISGWKYLTTAYYDTLLNDSNTLIMSPRDSLMAQEVIDWYERTKGKCLVITNYRHAFALKKNMALRKYNNEAQYIYDKFPEKTANVLIHGQRYNYFHYAPVQSGLWDRAIKNNGNTPVGFDLEDSPFGKNQFDMYPALHTYYNCLYQDIFTGYIFYKPEEKRTCSHSYYKKYAAEQEYSWAIKNHLIDSVRGKILVNSLSNMGGKLEDTHLVVLFITFYHFMDLLIWMIWGFCALIISCIRIIIISPD